MVEKVLSTLSPWLRNKLFDMHPVSSGSPYEMAEAVETKEHAYYTLCEDSGPVYHVPSSVERKVYEEFQGKRFQKLHHKDIV